MEESYLFCQLTPLVSFYHEIVYFVEPPLVIDPVTGLQLEGEFGVFVRVETNLRVWVGRQVVGVVGVQR